MSIQLLISYVLLGLTLAAPIGPVNSARLDKGIKNGFWHAWIVGTGSMMADAVFMLLIYMGVVQFLNIPIVQIFLWLFGGIILIYSGFESIKSANKIPVAYQGRRKDSLWRSFLVGFMLSITSPMSILFWLGIYGSILAKTATTYGTSHLLLYSSMIFLGLMLWDVCVASLTTGMRRFLNEKSLVGISVLSGLSLIGFGSYFGFQGIQALVS
ncbi:LysE family transporter [Paenibacillus methanolicus]|uniref:Threonine/homoserine/homoserine lactone efflux protein n=1 Tax=Paenibacillus methanolicus TaxID=582686 RepID=A0A5S5CLC9_9BACL|nr:LysE family transporter [Paenibacillus methanolicus]TYP79763.1 threonine/homoserine/homoserine lactone efflux protein [Paenibacillus methanolicus]